MKTKLIIKDGNSYRIVEADICIEYDDVYYIDGNIIPAEYVTTLSISFPLILHSGLAK